MVIHMEMEREMKNKSKLALFAAVLLQALLFLMPVTAFATAGEEQEIGVPQPMEVRAKGCFGVVLSPDGDGFYSVRDGLLTHYQIDPFNKTGSIAIDEAQLKDIPDKTECHVLITDDSSKLILVFREWIVLLDRSTGKISKKLERKNALKRFILEASTLNENDLAILARLPDGGFELTVLDARSLQIKKQISDLTERFGFRYMDESVPFITKIQDKLYLSSKTSLVVLNSKTYAPELALSRRSPTGMDVPIYISRDYRKLYVVGARFVTDHLTHFEKDYGEGVENSTAVFDQETRQISFEKIDFYKLSKEGRFRDQFDPLLFTLNQSRNRDYVSFSHSGKAGIASRNGYLGYFFYQYESGEAILKVTQYPDRKMSFQLTPGARQYLMMKTSTGKVVPINDATFTKYHADGTH